MKSRNVWRMIYEYPFPCLTKRSLWGFLVAGLFNLALAKGEFSLKPIELPSSDLLPKQSLHPVNVLGGPEKEFVRISEGGELVIYAMEGERYVVAQNLVLPTPREANGKTYVGFGRLRPNAPYSILLLMPEGLYAYGLAENRIEDSPKLLIKKPMIQGQGGESSVQYFEFALDLDADGMDELLLPESEGFSIYRQTAPLKFEPVALPKSPFAHEKIFNLRRQTPDDPVRVSALSGWFSQRKGVDNLVLFDANQDKKIDLVYTSILPGGRGKQVERYEIYYQQRGLRFPDSPSQVLELDYDERAYVTFRDFNRDGRTDAVVLTSNYDIVNPRTVIRFYLAGSKPYQFLSEPSDQLVTKDPIGLMALGDFNGDGFCDFATTFFSYQFGSAEDIASLVVANKVRFRLQFFLGKGGKVFSHQPDYAPQYTLNLKLDAYGGYQPFALVEDMNGDGFMDLAIRSDENKLTIYTSEGKLSYPRQPSATIAVPSDANMDFVDLNEDGLTDLVVSSLQKHSVSVYFSVKKP
ncbi:MAG: VCBS repeat-containing protein [Candidatus Hydrogenedentota bacterium]|nr:MAG: VCBS repeat-containing protein [Candidatus Hydrogenedentota bacterium]GIX44633.1 MAG: hypothetical protein KatS3mg130_1041 [Candidatus Sumerlaea sp.]